MHSPPGEGTGTPEGGQAICFTAGPAGAVFALGTIHAWLAADRRAPDAVAGISIGAVSAAAMQQCFQQLDAAKAEPTATPDKIEAKRWEWFRTYLGALSNSPLDVIWRVIPDPIDLFADKPPVIDYSCPPLLRQEEKNARKHYYQLTRLGIWLGRLPVRVSAATSLLVEVVRWREGYGKAGALAGMVWHAGKLAIQLVWHTASNPLFIQERSFLFPDERKIGPSALSGRPLFGWKTWLGTVGLVIAGPLAALSGAVLLAEATLFASTFETGNSAVWWVIFLAALTPLLLLAVAFWRMASGTSSGGLAGGLLKALEIDRGLLRDYHVHRLLLELFGEPDPKTGRPAGDVEISGGVPGLVIVAAPLEGVRSPDPASTDLKYEVFAARGRVKLVEALRTALAVPGLFPPVEAEPEQWGVDPEQVRWASPETKRKLHLVDGAVFRQTPLPSLLSWMRYHPDGKAGRRVEQVHVIYNVPIEPKPNPDDRDKVNIFEAATESIRLAKRRDTRQQAHQVKFISSLERLISTSEGGSSRPFHLGITEIAPEDDISFENPLNPKRQEVLAHAAAGCRRTLEALYGPEQAADGDVECGTLLASIAPARRAWVAESPGLPEICAQCTRRLSFRKPQPLHAPADGVLATYGTVEPPERVRLLPGFGELDGSRPAVTVLASGGAFRGVTYVGFIGALIAANIQPDLVVGASVGALLGAAMCATTEMLRRDAPTEARERLCDLVELFTKIDERVALTDTLKNALKQLGVRARRIQLSPAKVRRLIREGAGRDAGFAATGAPPELIDAISELFLIPHQATSAIAAEFVAGHFADAMKHLWEQVQRETLPKLNIETALMGSSLLESQVHAILRPFRPPKDWSGSTQPYGATKFFCTTTDINRRAPMLLGRDFLKPTESYDFIEACLSSSAFPAIFSPRRESEVLPGRGRTNVLFFDGGMFDNLPFLPAIDILSRVQSERLAGASMEEAVEDLGQRHAKPHILIAVSLFAGPDMYDDDQANLQRIRMQTLRRKSQVKIVEFESSLRRVKREVGMFLQGWKEGTRGCDQAAETIRRLNGIVIAETLRVVPASHSHVTGTFAFCRTLGLKKQTVEKAIADGCFQTLQTISKRTLNGLPSLERRRGPAAAPTCPFFTTGGAEMACPFAANASTDRVYTTCTGDAVHQLS